MKVKIKKLHENAVIPKYAKAGDAGMDLVAVSMTRHAENKMTYGTGLAFEIPPGYAGFIFPRSSIRDKDLSLTNCVGVIDSEYRGQVAFTFIEHYSDASEIYKIGDKVAQIIIMPYPEIEFEEVDELSTTERGSGGFGHTGN
jgi:dUTP pyrophosphatase